MKKTIYLSVVVCSLALTLSSCSKNEAATSNKNPASFNSTTYSLYSVKEQRWETFCVCPRSLARMIC